MGAFIFFYPVSFFFCCLFSDACCVCRLRNRCHRAQLEQRRNAERRRENLTLFCSPPPLFHPLTQSKPSYYTYTDSNLPIIQCIKAHLICGNWGSSDEGRDGGLCNHAVGGDAVRRRVEPEKGHRGRERKSGEESGNVSGGR